jgi:hypothetical protein
MRESLVMLFGDGSIQMLAFRRRMKPNDLN